MKPPNKKQAGGVFFGCSPLGGMQFSAPSEEDTPSRETTFLAVPLGEWDHPWYGKLHFTDSKVKRIAKNVKDNVRGVDVPVRYEPHFGGGKAAGWVTGATAKDDGLYLTVRWTPAALESIQNEEYRYFSAELSEIWMHPQSTEEYQDVLVGGVICCDPFLKKEAGSKQVEIAFANYVGPEGTTSDEDEDDMNWRKLLGLADTTPDEEVEEAVKTRLFTAPAVETPPADASGDNADKQTKVEETPPASGEGNTQGLTAEQQAQANVVLLTAQVTELSRQLKSVSDKQAEQEKNAKQTTALSAVEAAIGRKLPPAIRENKASYEFLIGMAENNPAGFTAYVESLPDQEGFVARGHGHTPAGEGAQALTATDRRVAEAEAKATGKPVDEILKAYAEVRKDRAYVPSAGN